MMPIILFSVGEKMGGRGTAAEDVFSNLIAQAVVIAFE